MPEAVSSSQIKQEIIMMDTPEFLDQIRTKMPISTVIGKRVTLRKQGHEWTGASPFTPGDASSLFVSDKKGVYHDFSTGKHGDVFDFVMETEGLSRAEAIERLAAAAAMPMAV
jgi:DNA primase